MTKEARGTKALLFIKEVLNDLRDYTLTDYTATKGAEKH